MANEAGDGSNNQGGSGANSGAANGSGNNGQAGSGGASNLYDAKFDISAHVPEALRTEPYFGSFKDKTVGDVFKSAVEAHKLVGGSVRIPGADAKAEEIAAFNSKLSPGADKYTYKFKDERLVSSMGDKTKSFFKVFHDNGVTDRAATAILQAYEDDTLATTKNFEDGLQTDVVAGEVKIKAKYGQQFERASVMATRAAKRFGGDAFVQLIKDYSLHTDPVFFDTMYSIAQAIHEDSFVTGEKPAVMLSKDGAKAKVEAVLADKGSPYYDESHPNHGAVAEQVRQWRKLMYAPAS